MVAAEIQRQLQKDAALLIRGEAGRYIPHEYCRVLPGSLRPTLLPMLSLLWEQLDPLLTDSLVVESQIFKLICERGDRPYNQVFCFLCFIFCFLLLCLLLAIVNYHFQFFRIF